MAYGKMKRAEKEQLCEEIDQFLSTRKWLLGNQPVWREDGRQDQLDATWLIEEEGGIRRSCLAFGFNRISTNEPSVSLIYQKKKVCRVDVKPADEFDGNPPQASEFGLPVKVFGPHIHLWRYNKRYVLECLRLGEWEIPIKSEISSSTRTLGHILACICDECGIESTPEQRDMTSPSREVLL